MNKLLLIVLLAVCLISVQAFVKRDAPADVNSENFVDKVKNDFQDLGKNIKEKLEDTFDPDNLKKGFNDLVDKVNKAVNDFKPKDPPAQ